MPRPAGGLAVLKELSELSFGHAALLTVAFVAVCAMLSVIAYLVAVQWRRVQQSEQEYAFKNSLLERGLPPAEVERLSLRQTMLPTGPAPGAAPTVTPSNAPRPRTRNRFLSYYVVTAVFVVAVVAIVNTSNRPRSDASKPLMPDRPVVLLQPGGSGTCRVFIDNGQFFPHGVRWNAVVLTRGNGRTPAELKVEAVPPKPTPDAPAPNFCDVNVTAVSGSGEFTVQVSAIDLQGKRAETTFKVQVKSSGFVFRLG
jgi:hypothetical protein